MNKVTLDLFIPNFLKKVSTYTFPLNLMAAVLLAFGLLTLFLSSSLLLDLFGIREKEGNYVLIVVWANLISSLIYLSSADDFIKSRKWTIYLLASSVLIMILAYIGFIFHVNGGRLHETKTFGALAFRTGFSTVSALIAFFIVAKSQKL